MAFDDEDLKSRVESWWQRPFSDFIGMTEEPEFNFSIRHYSAFSLLQVDILNESKKDKHWFLIPVGKRHHPQIYNVVITDFLLSIFRMRNIIELAQSIKITRNLAERSM